MTEQRSDNPASAYDAWSEWYDSVFGSAEQARAMFTGAYRAGFDAEPGIVRVLDAGCGTGTSTGPLLDLGFDVDGIDLSEASLEKARAALGDSRPADAFQAGDVLDDACLPGPYDAVVAMTNLPAHLPDAAAQRALFRALAARLRPGGMLFLSSQDYARLLAEEADDSARPPLSRRDARGPYLLLERRLWHGRPRERGHLGQYFRLDPTGETDRIDVRYHASTRDELAAMAAKAGFTDIEWLSPEETGYYTPIMKAFKVSDLRPAKPPPTVDNAPDFEPLAPKPEPGQEHHRFFPEDLGDNPFEEAPDFRRNTLLTLKREGGGQVVMRRKQVTLVMFSGGIDSVYVLQRLLRESDDEIIAHHIHFINPEGRHRAEAMACRQVVDYLTRTERPFMYTESTIDRRRFRAFGMDDMAVGFEVGVISNSFLVDRGHGIDRWTSGTCLEEELEYYGRSEVERFEHVLNSAAASAYPNEPPRFFQLKIIPKRDQIDYMGETLTGLCWTCREPVWQDDQTPLECGACKTCLLMAELRAGRPTIRYKPG